MDKEEEKKPLRSFQREKKTLTEETNLWQDFADSYGGLHELSHWQREREERKRRRFVNSEREIKITIGKT